MRLPPWLWRTLKSKWTKRLLIASPFLLMIAIAGFYGIANWWGARAIKQEIAAMRADGLPTTFEELFGPVPPAEDDVFQHPALMRQLEKRGTEDALQGLERMPVVGIQSGAKWESEPNLAKLSDARLLSDPARPGEDEAKVARELLQLIEPQSREFEACVEGLNRPVFHWGSGSEDLTKRCISLTRLLRFALGRALLRLAAGQPELAAADMNTALTIRERLGGPQGSLLGVTCLVLGQRSTEAVVWEGIRRGEWTEPQLAKFQSRLARFELNRVLRDAVPTELNYGKQALEQRSPDDPTGREWSEIRDDGWGVVIAPEWAKARELFAESWMKARPSGFDLLASTEHMRRMRQWYVGVRDGQRLPGLGDYEMWLPMLISEGFYQGIRTVHIQHTLTLCGIALERYRLKHGQSPERLDQLVPEFLPEVPKDLCDGQPLRYQILPDGGVHVWSLWPSGKDEGGMPHASREKGNTVWTTGQIPGLTEQTYRGR